VAAVFVVSYDIPSDKRRTKLAHALKDFGERVHYSVFECHLEEEGLELMRRRALKLIDEKEDSVRIYKLCGECRERREVHGQGMLTDDREVIIV
jgi:CRISPR-associated protein Cas2